MAIIFEENVKGESVKCVAQKMMIAARTAPKGKGIDSTAVAYVDGEDIARIAERMKKIGEECGMNAFPRDADNILNAEGMVLLGTKIAPLRLPKCGLCGHPDCDTKDKYPDQPCVFNTSDLGIAVGSAASIAMDNRVDNRIMYTVGIAAVELGIFDDSVKIVFGIPLSVKSKNIFFDRK